MNEKDKELIKSLTALLMKFKKLFHFGSAFIHHHAAAGEDSQPDAASLAAHKNVNHADTPIVNDATGENAIGTILKNEKLTNQDN